LTFTSDLELADAVADQWLVEIERTQRLGAEQHVALSGGRVARHFFRALVKQSNERNLRLHGIHFFWADERCVPPTDPESNYGVARQCLFAPLKIEAHHIHRIHGELAPKEAAMAAEEEIRRCVTCNQTGQPMLDLAFLGMGEDGHIASLFPGESDESVNSNLVYRAVTASKPPPSRITLSYAALVAAREVWVLASGSGKEQALRDSLVSTSQTPLGQLLQMRSSTRIFTEIQIGSS
jgi:6-phosphogluconolactonase